MADNTYDEEEYILFLRTLSKEEVQYLLHTHKGEKEVEYLLQNLLQEAAGSRE